MDSSEHARKRSALVYLVPLDPADLWFTTYWVRIGLQAHVSVALESILGPRMTRTSNRWKAFGRIQAN